MSEKQRMNRKSLLLDTNLLIYLKDKDSIYNHKALELINNFEGDIYTTSKNLSEYLVATTRGNSPLLNINEALKDIEEFEAIFYILYPTIRSTQKLKWLLQKYKPRGLKIHDFEIAAIGLSHQIEEIATLNASDFKKIEEFSFYEWTD